MRRVQLVGGSPRFNLAIVEIAPEANGILERNFPERDTETEWALARYKPTGETVETVIEVRTREGKIPKTVTAEVFQHYQTRWVAHPYVRTPVRYDPDMEDAPMPNEQLAFA